jgi:hypothetical protein
MKKLRDTCYNILITTRQNAETEELSKKENAPYTNPPGQMAEECFLIF